MTKAEAELAKLEAIAISQDVDEYRVGATPVSAVLQIASLGLAGEILQAKGNYTAAIAAFEAGVAIEDQNNYTEPPDWAQPMRHYLGAALLESDRAAEAEAVYRRDLRWNQNNGWSLFGLYQALDMQGKEGEAEAVYAEYQASWQNSDVMLARSRL